MRFDDNCSTVENLPRNKWLGISIAAQLQGLADSEKGGRGEKRGESQRPVRLAREILEGQLPPGHN